MSEITTKKQFCEVGETEGIYVEHYQLQEFGNFLNTHHSDEYIPLPNLLNEDQKLIIGQNNCEHDVEDIVYWETEEGVHGWCCSNCGKVLQWG